MINDVIQSDAVRLLRGLPESSVPLIVSDPPYGIAYFSNHYKDKNPHSPVTHDWNFQIGPFFRECARVLKDGGAAYLFCCWDVMPLWVPEITPPLKLKSVIAWVKDNWSAGDLSGCFGNQYEQILFVTKGRHLLRGRRWSNVWSFSRIPAKKLLHPTQKPADLIERAVLASSDPGDLVVDPFAGSGSTAVACVNTGRNYLLGDIDQKMVELSRRRLGLPVETSQPEPEEVREETMVEFPDPLEWGIHPEDLLAIAQALKESREELKRSE